MRTLTRVGCPVILHDNLMSNDWSSSYRSQFPPHINDRHSAMKDACPCTATYHRDFVSAHFFAVPRISVSSETLKKGRF